MKSGVQGPATAEGDAPGSAVSNAAWLDLLVGLTGEGSFCRHGRMLLWGSMNRMRGERSKGNQRNSSVFLRRSDADMVHVQRTGSQRLGSSRRLTFGDKNNRHMIARVIRGSLPASHGVASRYLCRGTDQAWPMARDILEQYVYKFRIEPRMHAI